MTFVEFLAIVEEYNLPVENPERFRFMIKDMSAAEFRAHLDKDEDGPQWRFAFDDEERLTDGNGNYWTPPRRTDS